MRRDLFSGFARMSTAPAWAMASVRMDAGSTGTPPGPAMKYRSSDETFLIPTIRRSSWKLDHDAVDEEEGIAVGEDPLDVLDLEGQLEPAEDGHGPEVYF